MAGTICDVCRTEGEVQVLASRLGAASFAYCTTCFQVGAEPLGAVVATVWTLGWENIHPWSETVIEASLERMGMTREQLDEAVSETDKQYRAEFER